MKASGKFLAASMAMILGVSISACKKDDIQPNPGTTQNEANSFQVRMTDAPGDYKSLDVELTSVDVFLEGSGWVDLENDAQMVSVLDLTNGIETEIAFNSNVEAGTYSKVRLTFGSNNSLELNSSSTLGITLPGGISTTSALDLVLASDMTSERTVEIEIDETVSSSSGASILLDFDVAASIMENSNTWVLDPSIRLVSDVSTGAMGEIEGTQQASIIFESNNSSFTSSTNTSASGNFLIQGLEEGSYTVIINAEVEGQSSNETLTLDNVIIAQGSIKNMGSIDFD